MRTTQASNHTKGRSRGARERRERVEGPPLSSQQMEDLRWAAAQMTGAVRRAFQAEMTLKYWHGSARFAETRLGGRRAAGEGGLAERRTGIGGVDGHAAWSGRKRWEEKYPEAAEALCPVAEAHAQQDPTFRTTRAYTRLTAKAARAAVQEQGIAEAQLPASSTMAEVLHRMGARLRKGVKAQPQKKSPETDAIFANLKKRPGPSGYARRQAAEPGR